MNSEERERESHINKRRAHLTERNTKILIKNEEDRAI